MAVMISLARAQHERAVACDRLVDRLAAQHKERRVGARLKPDLFASALEADKIARRFELAS